MNELNDLVVFPYVFSYRVVVHFGFRFLLGPCIAAIVIAIVVSACVGCGHCYYYLVVLYGFRFLWGIFTNTLI